MKQRQRAQALVEFALVALVFFIMIFALVDLGRAVWNYNTISFLARDAARQAEVSSTINLSRCNAMLTPACSVSSSLPAANAAIINVTVCGGASRTATVTYGFVPASAAIAQLWGGNGATIYLTSTSQVYVTPGVCPP
jgi:Flp pilus assembly protein TadG